MFVTQYIPAEAKALSRHFLRYSYLTPIFHTAVPKFRLSSYFSNEKTAFQLDEVFFIRTHWENRRAEPRLKSTFLSDLQNLVFCVFKHKTLTIVKVGKKTSNWFCLFIIYLPLSIQPAMHLFKLEQDSLKVPFCLLLCS